MLLVQIQIRFLSNSDVIALYLAAVPWLLSMSVSTYTEMSVAALYCQVCSALLTFLLQLCSYCGHTAHSLASPHHTHLSAYKPCMSQNLVDYFLQPEKISMFSDIWVWICIYVLPGKDIARC